MEFGMQWELWLRNKFENSILLLVQNLISHQTSKSFLMYSSFFHDKHIIYQHVNAAEIFVMLMRNPNRSRIIQPNIPQHDKYDELCSKIHYKFRSNSNLPCNLNEKCTSKFHIWIHLSYLSLANRKSSFKNYFSLYLHACKFYPSMENSITLLLERGSLTEINRNRNSAHRPQFHVNSAL